MPPKRVPPKAPSAAEPRLPHANPIEWLAIFRSGEAANHLKSQKDKVRRAAVAQAEYGGQLRALVNHKTC